MSATSELSLYLNELHSSLTQILKCPLISKLSHITFTTNEDEDDILNFADEKDKRIFNDLKCFILPSDQRLSLIEWLLE